MSQRFDTDFYERKLQQVQQAELDVIVVAPGSLLQSLCGIGEDTHERFAALVLVGGQRHAIFPATDDTVIATSLLPELDVAVQYWRDGEDPYALVAALVAAAVPEGAVRVGINADLRGDHVLGLQAALPQASLSTIDALFAQKQPEELAELAAVGAAIDRVHAQVPELLRTGRTEAEVAADLHELILQEHVAVDFIIVGSAEHGAMPHHSYSDRVLASGDVVVVDIGGTNAAGYHSDCTRTYVVDGAVDQVPAEVRAAYEVLYQAQEQAVAAVRPGITAAAIDALARDAITAAGYGEYFSHRTGHGIGVSTHEPPFISGDSTTVLRPGMAFSVEPGIYLPGKWGMRIEDIVLVTETGVQRCNNEPRKLR